MHICPLLGRFDPELGNHGHVTETFRYGAANYFGRQLGGIFAIDYYRKALTFFYLEINLSFK